MYQRISEIFYIALFVGIWAVSASNTWCQQPAGTPTLAVPDTPPVDSSEIVPVPRPQNLDPTETISIAQLEQMAESHNPTLAQAVRQVEAIQGRQVQIGLYPNPLIGYQAEEIGENGRTGQHGMYVRQEIVTANKLGLNQAVVTEEVRQAEWNLQMQRQRILNDVRSRAYEALAAQQTMAVAEELVLIGQTAVDVADRLYRAQETSQVDVLQARVEANSAKLQLAAAEKAHTAAWRRLTIVVGVPGVQPSPLTDRLDGDLPDLSWDDTSRTLLNQSPQLAHAYSGVERAR